MKAALMTAPGEPDVLQLGEVLEPTIQQETEVLVRLKAAGVNPIDTKLRRRGTFFPDRLPAILGCDGAGIVEAVGASVRQFQPGDEVYFCNGGLGGHPGNYAEWAIVDARFAAHKPTTMSFAEAAAAPLVLITAWEALFDRARLQAGQRVLIHAGAGGVGHVAIQLAKWRGAEVCTTVSTEAKAVFVRDRGASQVLFYKDTEVAQAVMNWTHGQGVDVAFDTVGGAALGQSFAATKFYGDIVTILDADPATNWKLARTRNQRVSFELMLLPMLQGLMAVQQSQAAILQQCAELIDAGHLKLHVGQTFPLAEAAAAHQAIESGSTTGKLVLVMD
ncbi:zinc-dependent alcohol dehydrogenase family protein [Stenomitos frigidus]|uniref:Alcohol dehydrogenase n=1 Tax=Stenomitos frigidus ULC18 TaxID=2107698 RepID=A0A2T1ER59_9CYAN|nr:zinc-dependent alcohol dehydrogenase family protein [Stenomitos frigidus]PSB35191.1 alcohol dehydrogenase [Stenomitos frigidus ULC18]